MKEVLLGLTIIGLFAFGYFVAVKIGGFMGTNYRSAALRNGNRRVFVTFAPGNSARETAEQIKQLGDAYGGCVVIVCDAKQTDIEAYLDTAWCDGESRFKIG